MKPFSHLHDALKNWLAPTEWAHQTHLTVALLMVAALIHTGTVSLTKWALCLPNRGDKQRVQSQQRRLSSWIHNARINVHRLYKPIITQALADWREPVMYVALDTSLFWEEYCLVRLAVVHKGRSLPLCWCVLHHPSASVAYAAYAWILKRAAGCIPKGVKVVLLADRGFVQTELMKALTKHLGWNYRIRLKCDSWIWRGKKGWCQLKDYHLNRGRLAVSITSACTRALIMEWFISSLAANNVNGEFWAIVSDEKTILKTFEEFGLRFDIEEGFLDDQSSGWNVQHSEIRDNRALSRLWFILALATLYVSAQGLKLSKVASVKWLILIGFGATAIFGLGWIG